MSCQQNVARVTITGLKQETKIKGHRERILNSIRKNLKRVELVEFNRFNKTPGCCKMTTVTVRKNDKSTGCTETRTRRVLMEMPVQGKPYENTKRSQVARIQTADEYSSVYVF